MSFKYFRVLLINTFNTADESGGDCFQRLQETFHSFEENGFKYELKVGQRKAIRQLFERRDVLAVLPTSYAKSLIFSCVLVARTAEARNFACLLVIQCNATNIVNDQIGEIEAMNFSAFNLA